MGLGEIQHLYRDAREEGFVFNNIWGGEPLLREDLDRVVQTSKQNSFLTTVVTNGEFLEERHTAIGLADVLVVSLDAPGQLHDRIRGIEGLFEKAVKGLELVRARYPKVHVNICCVLSTLNRGKIPEMMELARQTDASIFFCPVGDNASIEQWPYKEHVAAYMKSRDEIREDFRIIRESKKRGYPVESSFYLCDYFIHGTKPYSCSRPWVYLNLYANGDVETCYLGVFANVREKPLHEILRLPEYRHAAKMSRDCAFACNANDAIEISGLWSLHPRSLRNWL
jgi:MoaA/NifB/PqqE/SkfB family radical SAM enzyme